MFSFAKKQGYIHPDRKTSAELSEKFKEAETDIEIFTPEEMGRILLAAHARILPFLAIGAFAGIRSAEIHRLDWSVIKWDRGHIEIAGKKAKTAARRLVPLTDTQVHSVEIAAAHLEFGYAGRVDLVATLRSTGRPTVVDFKTQKTRRDKNGSFKPIIHDTWPLQLEAYRMALASRDKGLSNAAIASVVIGSTEPVPVVVKVWDDTDKAAFFKAFLAARDLWVWQKNYCPVRDAPDSGDETPPTALVPA